MKKLTCKDASRLMSEGYERPLGLGERLSLRLHLWICDNCSRFEKQLGLLRKALRLLPRNLEKDVPGPDLSPEARERIGKAISDEHSQHRH